MTSKAHGQFLFKVKDSGISAAIQFLLDGFDVLKSDYAELVRTEPATDPPDFHLWAEDKLIEAAAANYFRNAVLCEDFWGPHGRSFEYTLYVVARTHFYNSASFDTTLLRRPTHVSRIYAVRCCLTFFIDLILASMSPRCGPTLCSRISCARPQTWPSIVESGCHCLRFALRVVQTLCLGLVCDLC